MPFHSSQTLCVWLRPHACDSTPCQSSVLHWLVIDIRSAVQLTGCRESGAGWTFLARDVRPRLFAARDRIDRELPQFLIAARTMWHQLIRRMTSTSAPDSQSHSLWLSEWVIDSIWHHDQSRQICQVYCLRGLTCLEGAVPVCRPIAETRTPESLPLPPEADRPPLPL